MGKALLVPLGDDALVEQVRRGNERAFEVIYDRHHAGLLAFCRHMLGSLDEAEDALQQVFVSAHADLLRSRRPIALRAWLYTIARNRCLSMLRTRREHVPALVDPSTAGFADDVEQRLELRALVADLRDLPDEQREALVLAEIADLSHAEIGRVLGCEAARVKSLIFQARSKLIEGRKARETPCAEIREQLATVRGGALRRSELRRHLKVCPGCAEFKEEVRRQRAMLAVVLPVLPSVALKRSVLAAAGIGSGGGGAGAGGAGVVAGMAVKGGAAKLATGCALGALAVGGGIVLHDDMSGSSGSALGPSPATGAAPHQPAAPGSVTVVPARPAPVKLSKPEHHRTPPASAHHRHHGRALAKGHAKQDAVTQAETAPVAARHGKALALGHTKAHKQTPVAHKQPTHTPRARAHSQPGKPPDAADPASPLVDPKEPRGKALGTTG